MHKLLWARKSHWLTMVCKEELSQKKQGCCSHLKVARQWLGRFRLADLLNLIKGRRMTNKTPRNTPALFPNTLHLYLLGCPTKAAPLK